MNPYIYMAIQSLLPVILLYVNDLERHKKQYIVFVILYQFCLGALLRTIV